LAVAAGSAATAARSMMSAAGAMAETREIDGR
jgi:hypothetical protein